MAMELPERCVERSMKPWLLVFIVFCAICTQSAISVFAFESGLWPGEGRPVFVAKMDLNLHEKPSADSLIVKNITIPKGQKIDFIETRYRTTKSGLVKVESSFTGTARSYGSIDFLSKNDYYGKGTDTSINLKSGDTIEFLQYRAEGHGFFKMNGEILECDLSGFNEKVTVISEPVTEWWIRVVNEKKESIGWVLINEKTVEFLDREF